MQTFLAIKRCQRTKIRKIIKLARSSKKSVRRYPTTAVKLLKRRRGQRLPSRSDETEIKPPAKSPETDYPYYKQFPLRLRDEPAAVNLGAHAGLKNSNVNCYSNAIFQCIASCICFSDFSPSEKHPKFPLNHAFASLMSSMVGREESVDPSLFMNVFMHLFWPGGEENINQQEGMYYDCA